MDFVQEVKKHVCVRKLNTDGTFCFINHSSHLTTIFTAFLWKRTETNLFLAPAAPIEALKITGQNLQGHRIGTERLKITGTHFIFCAKQPTLQEFRNVSAVVMVKFICSIQFSIFGVHYDFEIGMRSILLCADLTSFFATKVHVF